MLVGFALIDAVSEEDIVDVEDVVVDEVVLPPLIVDVEDVDVDEVVLPPPTVDVEDVDVIVPTVVVVDEVEVIVPTVVVVVLDDVVVTGREAASAIATLLWYMLRGYELVLCQVPTPEPDMGA